jgi:phosphatidylglycerol:prolipoprotein diacylglycerol transferase
LSSGIRDELDLVWTVPPGVAGVGGRAVELYFCVAVIGILTAWLFARRNGVNRYAVGAFALAMAASGLLLGRVYAFSVFAGESLSAAVAHAFERSGYSIWGFILAWIVLVSIGSVAERVVQVMRGRSRSPFTSTSLADAFALCLAVSVLLGRLVCLVNGCCVGRPTGVCFGVVYPPCLLAGLVFGPEPLHPAQLYEAAGMLTFIIAAAVLAARGCVRGVLAGLFLVTYGVTRAMVQPFRVDYVGQVLELRSPVVHGLVLAIVGVAVFGRLELARRRQLASDSPGR